MAQETTSPADQEASFSDPLADLAAEIQAKEGPRVENGQVKLPPEAAAILASAANQVEVHRHLERLKSDEPTYQHTRRVALNALALGWINRDAYDITAEEFAILARASLLHDVGKLDNPDVIDADGSVRKIHQASRPLNPAERDHLSDHAMMSVGRLQSEYQVSDPMILGLIALHHQIQARPALNQGDAEAVLADLKLTEAQKSKLLSLSQMLEAADKYDAMTESRSYRQQPLAPEQIKEHLFETFAAHHADTRVVEQIMQLHAETDSTDDDSRSTRFEPGVRA